MKFLICSAVAMAIASPALAQKSGATTNSEPPTAVTSADPSSTAPSAAPPNDPEAILKSEFPVYDKDANGNLSKTEFSSWLVALKKAAPQQTPMTDAQQSEWLGKAFSDADADKSTTVSLAELTTYLTRGSAS